MNASASAARQATLFSFQQTCPDVLDRSATIDSDATLHYAVVPPDPPWSGNNGLLCARLEVEEHDGWVGIAISEDGKMGGSVAMIGIPDDGTVLKYNLLDDWATEMPEDEQTLGDASIRREEGGKTIMEFAKLLTEEGEVPISYDDVNTFLHARGDGGTLGYHSTRVVFDLGSAAPTGAPTAMPVVSTWSPTTGRPTGMPVTDVPSGQPTASPVTERPTTVAPSAAPSAKPSGEPAPPADAVSSACPKSQSWKASLVLVVVAIGIWLS